MALQPGGVVGSWGGIEWGCSGGGGARTGEGARWIADEISERRGAMEAVLRGGAGAGTGVAGGFERGAGSGAGASRGRREPENTGKPGFGERARVASRMDGIGKR